VAEIPVRATVCGQEDDREGRPYARRSRDAAAADRAWIRIRAREFDQRRSPRRVVARSLTRADVVTVGDNDDRTLRASRCDCEQVAQLCAAATGDVRAEALSYDLVAVRPQLLAEPARCTGRARSARDAVRIVQRE